MTTVVGLDLSLTSSGLARITWIPPRPTTWAGLDMPGPPVVETWTRGEKGITTMPDPRDRCRSLVHIRADVLAFVESCDLVVIEDMVPNPVSRSTNERGALWYLVLSRLLDHETPTMFVHPNTLKRYATGSGAPKGKTPMKDAAKAAFAGVRVRNGDEADALWLAAIGMHLLDGPVPFEVTDYRTEIADGLRASIGEVA